jgi:bifunctional ADP-heptose synthase (sugar kinase/adenylyltransferase)
MEIFDLSAYREGREFAETVSRVYQRTLTFVYLKAVHDVTGAGMTVFNSLTSGLYTEIDSE